MSPSLSLAIRLFLSATFAWAALTKLRTPGSVELAILEFRIVPQQYASVIARILPTSELVLAFLLLTGTGLLVAAPLAACLFTVFAVAMGVNMARGRVVHCYCFGSAASKVGSRTLLRNAVLVAVSGMLAGATYQAPSTWLSSWRTDVGLLMQPDQGIVIAVIVATGLALLFLIEHMSAVSILMRQTSGRSTNQDA